MLHIFCFFIVGITALSLEGSEKKKQLADNKGKGSLERCPSIGSSNHGSTRNLMHQSDVWTVGFEGMNDMESGEAFADSPSSQARPVSSLPVNQQMSGQRSSIIGASLSQGQEPAQNRQAQDD